MRFIHVCSAAALAVVLGSCSGGGSSGTSVPNLAATPGGVISPAALYVIPEVDSIGGTANLTLQAQFNAQNRPSFLWNGQEVAPTIRVRPGETINLTFVNALPEFCSVGVETDANIHFHGMHTSPIPPGDNVVTTKAVPGGSTTYVIHMNPDQPPGLYWYHAHLHGLSAWEVGNGLSGAIVVEGIANYVPQTAGLRERVIVLRDPPVSSSFAAGEQSILRRTASNAQSTSTRRPLDGDSTGGNACNPETDMTPTINGARLASIGIKPGETELIRVVNAASHRHYDLAVDGHQLQLVAQDGVPINMYPGSPATVAVNDVLIPPAGRAEFLVTGGAAPAALISKCYGTGPIGNNDPEVALGVFADDTHWPGVSTATTQSVRRVAKLAAIRRSPFFSSRMPAPVQERMVHFSEDANGLYINGLKYDANAASMFTAKSGTVEEWTVENDSQEVHVFHIHQVHFIVESVNGVANPSPHWLDTADISSTGIGVAGQIIPSQMKLLIDFRDPVIRGTFVFHCHILDHEDHGMMAKITVL
jgi:FtsP/CotA-like multicopper oxidase with cupredoxin domain